MLGQKLVRLPYFNLPADRKSIYPSKLESLIRRAECLFWQWIFSTASEKPEYEIWWFQNYSGSCQSGIENQRLVQWISFDATFRIQKTFTKATTTNSVLPVALMSVNDNDIPGRVYSAKLPPSPAWRVAVFRLRLVHRETLPVTSQMLMAYCSLFGPGLFRVLTALGA